MTAGRILDPETVRQYVPSTITFLSQECLGFPLVEEPQVDFACGLVERGVRAVQNAATSMRSWMIGWLTLSTLNWFSLAFFSQECLGWGMDVDFCGNYNAYCFPSSASYNCTEPLRACAHGRLAGLCCRRKNCSHLQDLQSLKLLARSGGFTLPVSNFDL